MAAQTGTLTLESPHTLLNLTLLLQQEKLTPCIGNFTDVPSWEKIEEKGRGKLWSLLQVSQETEWHFGLQEVWVSKLLLWSWTISNRESPLCAWHALAPAHGRLLVGSGNKLGSFLERFSGVDKSQSGEPSGGTLNSWCGFHLRVLACRAEICYFLHQCSFWLYWSWAEC